MTSPNNVKLLLQGNSGSSFASSYPGWDEHTPVCEWHGVKCDNSRSVTELDLGGYGLEGTLPAAIGRIQSLSRLYLGSNTFHGTFPKAVASLPNLVHLDLSSNLLEGRIPTMVSKKLELVALGKNQFTGTLSSKIFGGLNMLGTFDVKYNLLTGTIPSFDSSKTSLVELDLSNNLFQGTIPESLGDLEALDRLHLSNNMFRGTIPMSLGNERSRLREIFLHGNMLSGTIPVTLASLSRLEILFVDGNKLVGSVPKDLCALSLNEIFFHGTSVNVDETYNEMFGNVNATKDQEATRERRVGVKRRVLLQSHKLEPRNQHIESSFRFRKASETDLARDGCNSIACGEGYFSKSGDGKDGVFPCQKCDPAHVSPYLGSRKCYTTDQEEILRELYDATNGEEWRDNQSWTAVPPCERAGVTCDNKGKVISIILPDMNLSGTLPEELGFLSYLEQLDLSQNRIEGNIPAELRFAPLNQLDVTQNFMTGSVPLGLCKKDGVNGNGLDGIYGCDVTSCQMGYYSSSGQASPGLSGETCKPCGAADRSEQFLGSTSCEPNTSTEITPLGWFGDLLLIFLGSAVVFFILCFVWRRYKAPKEEFQTNGGDQECDWKDEIDHLPVDGSSSNASSVASVSRGSRNNWSFKRERKSEVWLDVPKIQ